MNQNEKWRNRVIIAAIYSLDLEQLTSSCKVKTCWQHGPVAQARPLLPQPALMWKASYTSGVFQS